GVRSAPGLARLRRATVGRVTVRLRAGRAAPGVLARPGLGRTLRGMRYGAGRVDDRDGLGGGGIGPAVPQRGTRGRAGRTGASNGPRAGRSTGPRGPRGVVPVTG